MYSRTIDRESLHTWARILGILLFAVATAISARISILTPLSPVPLTMQVLVVILSGFVLGGRDGLIAQAIYLQIILLGAPFTAMAIGGPAAFVMPSAGYLIAFPIAAFAAGWIAQQGTSRKVLWRALGGFAALAVIYALGTAWLSAFVGGPINAFRAGVLPFVTADALKVIIATAALSTVKR